MALTAQQLEDIRGDIGDISSAFSDAEINRIYDRLSAAPNEDVRMRAVLGMMFDRLLNNSAKLHDYVAGSVSESLDQVYQHLKERAAAYAPALEVALGGNNQLVISKLGKRANAVRQWPTDWTND